MWIAVSHHPGILIKVLANNDPTVRENCHQLLRLVLWGFEVSQGAKHDQWALTGFDVDLGAQSSDTTR